MTSPQNTSASQNSGSTTSNASSAPEGDTTYPEQMHAGKVGYGPNYRNGPSLEDKVQGLKEELKGKLTRNPELVQHGKQVKSGEEKKKKLTGEDEPNPFTNAKDDASEGTDKGQDTSTDPKPTREPSQHQSPDHNTPGMQHSQPIHTPVASGFNGPLAMPEGKIQAVSGVQSPHAHFESSGEASQDKNSSQTDPFGMAPSQVSGQQYAHTSSANANMTGMVDSSLHQPQPLDQTSPSKSSQSGFDNSTRGTDMSAMVDSARHESQPSSNSGFDKSIPQQSTNMTGIVDSARHEPKPLGQTPEYSPSSNFGAGNSLPQQNRDVNEIVDTARHQSQPLNRTPAPTPSSNFESGDSIPQQPLKANPFGMAVNQGYGKGAMEQAATVAPEGTEDAEKQRKGNNVDFATRPVEARQ